MKNDRILSDIGVSPIFSQLFKERRKKIIQRCSNLVIQQMQVFIFVCSKPKVHALPNNKKTWFLFDHNLLWILILEIYPREGPRDNLFAKGGGGGSRCKGCFLLLQYENSVSSNFLRNDLTPPPSRSTPVWYSSY